MIFPGTFTAGYIPSDGWNGGMASLEMTIQSIQIEVFVRANLNVSRTTNIINVSLLRKPSEWQNQMSKAMMINKSTKQSVMYKWKSNSPEKGRVFQYQFIIILPNYRRHVSQGLLRDPSLLRGINQPPFLESRHLIICWPRCTIKLLRPTKSNTTWTWSPNLWGMNLSSDFDFLFLFVSHFYRNVSGSCELVKKSWKFHPQINWLQITNHPLRKTLRKYIFQPQTINVYGIFIPTFTP